MISIQLPDGSKREFPGPVTVAEVAASIGAGLAKAALAGKVNGKMDDQNPRRFSGQTVKRERKAANYPWF